MATLTIRDVPDKQRDRLRKQAAANGRSMEAEARRLLLEGIVRSKQPVVRTVAALHAIPAKASAKGRKRKVVRDLLTAKERSALKPDAQAALQRLREMFADRKGEERGSLVQNFLAERRAMWGEE